MAVRFSSQERKRFWTICCIVLGLLCLWLIFSPSGVVRYYRIRQQLESVNNEVVTLKQQNILLDEEVRRLEKDPAFVEDVARDEYGMIRKNEIIFDFSKRNKNH
ncbi:MAG: septum formation initiator family protein [Desulfobulbaceae bacterium]|nr:septum formation initiator family protein [Desulfobulbaceae bacterium]